MKDTASDEDVIERLQFALAAEALPKAAREHASLLLKRLSSPVRVSVLGLPGAGKSELLNMFIGQRLLPKDSKLPTTELTYGTVERIVVTDASGARQVVDGLDFEKARAFSPAFMRVEIPIPLLQRISLLEVVTDGSSTEFQSAIDWAVRRTDIALWCTQTFGPAEAKLWGRVPDSLKDHAFLVLSKADVLSAKSALTSRIADLETIVSEEFHSLFAVATLQAIKAHGADGEVDEAIYHASGGGALSAEILRHAERGRRADVDSAHLFLARYQIKSPPKASSPHKVVEEKAEASDKAAQTSAAVAEPQRDSGNEFVDEIVENEAIFLDSVRFLRRRGDGLLQAATDLGRGKADGIVEQCVDAVEHLVDLFSDDDSGCTVVDAFLDDLTEASDLMVLMQVESGDASAADAATLLLQLRREMEMKLAA
ncbi:MAG: GTPase domain-containing protein [Boseongicola sp.]|nr:GTPase domain-containing protein [Boseongicola sp.]